MESRNIVFVVGLLLASGLLFWVITSTSAEMVYDMTVDQALASYDDVEGTEMKVRGNVVPGSIRCRPGTDECRFQATKNGATIEVYYAGPRPDTFKDCAEVVVTGRFTSPERFDAEDLIAKCPSKYDALPGGCEARPEETEAAEGASSY